MIKMSGAMLQKSNFNPQNLTVNISGEVVELLYQEYKLLEYLVANKGKIISRDEILLSVWNVEGVVVTRTVDMHIARLRKKLSKFNLEEKIRTIRSKGYVFL